MLGIVLVVSGSVGMLFGMRFVRRAWQSRSSWQKDSFGILDIPARDHARIAGGTVLTTFSVTATAFGILLLAANSVGA